MSDRHLRSSFDTQMSLETQIVYIRIVNSVYDGTFHSNIGHETLIQSCGLNRKTVDKALQYLQDNDYIKPAKQGWIVTKKAHYDIYDISLIGAAGEGVKARKAEMVALRLASCRLNGNEYTMLTDTAIIERIGLSKATWYAYRKILIDSAIITKGTDRYYLDTEYFPIPTRRADIPEELQSTVRALLTTKTQGGAIFAKYYNNGFTGLTMPIDKFIKYCSAGCPGAKKKPLSTEYEFPED